MYPATGWKTGCGGNTFLGHVLSNNSCIWVPRAVKVRRKLLKMIRFVRDLSKTQRQLDCLHCAGDQYAHCLKRSGTSVFLNYKYDRWRGSRACFLNLENLHKIVPQMFFQNCHRVIACILKPSHALLYFGMGISDSSGLMISGVLCIFTLHIRSFMTGNIWGYTALNVQVLQPHTW